jgi:hypothetical protein
MELPLFGEKVLAPPSSAISMVEVTPRNFGWSDISDS